MSNPLQPGQHLDADQLNAFLEGALPEHEHLESLAHLSECGDCRRIVFLAQRPMLSETQPVVPAGSPIPFWQRWSRPLVLVAATAACVLLFTVSLYRLRTPQGPPPNVAKNNVPSPPVQPAVSTAAPKGPEPHPLKASSPPETRPPKPTPLATAPAKQAAPAVIGGVLGGVATAPASQPQAQGSTSGMARGNGSGFASPTNVEKASGTAADARSTPFPGQPSASVGQVQPSTGQIHGLSPEALSGNVAMLPTQGRSIASGFTENGPLKLTIEHDRGPDNGLSALSGSVTDGSGAVIPRATITLHPSTGNATASAGVSTDAQGKFTLSAVPAGRYEIRIASPGFQTLSRQIELQPRDIAQLKSTLTVGAASETVAVQATGPLIETESAGMSGAPRGKEPGRQPLVSSVTDGSVRLVIDSDGILYRSDSGGSHWKKIKAKWQSRATQVSTITIARDAINKANASGNEAQGKIPPGSPERFQLATSSGEMWVSADGKHWRRR